MIRYVLIVLITVALLALSLPAIDHVAAQRAENQVESEVQTIDRVATNLFEEETVPPAGVDGPKRVLTLRLPSDSFTSDAVEYIRIRRITDRVSLATYRVPGRAERRIRIDAPIVNEDGGIVELGGEGERRIHLTLERDDEGDPVIVLGRGGA